MHSFRSYLALNKHYLISCNIIHIRRAKAGIKIYVQTLHFGIYGRVTWQIADNQLDLPRMGSTEVCHQNASLRLRSHKSLPLPRGLQQKQAYGNDSLEGSCTQNIPTVCFLPPSLPYFSPRGSTCYYVCDTWKALWILQEIAHAWVDFQSAQWHF